MRASGYYGLEMYSDQGNYVGGVEEVMLDLDEAKVAGLVFERTGEENRMVLYENVSAVGDVIIVESRREEEGTTMVGIEEAGE